MKTIEWLIGSVALAALAVAMMTAPAQASETETAAPITHNCVPAGTPATGCSCTGHCTQGQQSWSCASYWQTVIVPENPPRTTTVCGCSC